MTQTELGTKKDNKTRNQEEQERKRQTGTRNSTSIMIQLSTAIKNSDHGWVRTRGGHAQLVLNFHNCSSAT
jgi:hypothetical protein